jgi:oligopeptide/dipeptide ABC transporter ATP-binding protein
MYLGALVEKARSDDLYRKPLHLYAKALMSSVALPDQLIEASRERILPKGGLPSPANPLSGCRFRTAARGRRSAARRSGPSCG